MKIPLYNPINKPLLGPKIKPAKKLRKPRPKGIPLAATLKGMYKQEEIFKNRISSHWGLTSDENIELFYGLSSAKVLNLSYRDRNLKWANLRGINKWLKRKGKMAIIFDTMKRGSILSPPPGENYPGTRKLSRDANVYFRCVKIVDSSGYINKNEKIINGIDTTNENTEDIVHKEEKEEQQRKDEKEVLEKLNSPPQQVTQQMTQ